MSKKIAITNGNLYCEDHQFRKNLVLLIENGKIDAICEEKKADLSSCEIINANENYVLPGFIDIHVNGGGGHLAIEGTNEAIINMTVAHALQGTTSIVPTTISCNHEQLKKCVSTVSDIMNTNTDRMNILGVHLEGPFISPKKAGAHKKEYLSSPSIDLFNELYDASKGCVRILSLAPELKNAMDIIECAIKRNVMVGLAHSEADYTTTCEAINKGMTLCTHIFNAMPPLSHREPGPVGAFMSSKGTFTEIIADGFHVHPAVIELIIKANSPGQTILVTDAVTPAGTDTKQFMIDGTFMNVKEYSCFTKEGMLGGSALTLNRAVDIVNKKTNIELENIIRMVTETPAVFLNVFDKKGSLSVGKDADIVVANADMDIMCSIVNGNVLTNNDIR